MLYYVLITPIAAIIAVVADRKSIAADLKKLKVRLTEKKKLAV